jgi:hypothetical protein
MLVIRAAATPSTSQTGPSSALRKLLKAVVEEALVGGRKSSSAFPQPPAREPTDATFDGKTRPI